MVASHYTGRHRSSTCRPIPAGYRWSAAIGILVLAALAVGAALGVLPGSRSVRAVRCAPVTLPTLATRPVLCRPSAPGATAALVIVQPGAPLASLGIEAARVGYASLTLLSPSRQPVSALAAAVHPLVRVLRRGVLGRRYSSVALVSDSVSVLTQATRERATAVVLLTTGDAPATARLHLTVPALSLRLSRGETVTASVTCQASAALPAGRSERMAGLALRWLGASLPTDGSPSHCALGGALHTGVGL